MINLGLPFNGFTPEEKTCITTIISDVDDTITKNGKLFPAVLDALWRLKSAGKTIFLVTGGSAGWADCYLRQWPVDAVIAESGALMICFNKKKEIVQIVNPVINVEIARKRKAELMRLTNGLPFSSDQSARIFDIAYDKSRLEDVEIKVLKNTLTALGATYAESSIHINAWFGKYDKKRGLDYFLKGPLGMTEDEILNHSIYLGDSLNDQSLFGYIPFSIGMYSVQERRDEFETLPRYITQEGSGDGVVRVVDELLN